MRQFESQFRQNDYSPPTRTNQTPFNDETEKRIVMLYTSGKSVESITRELGRARHRVVHVLQTKGVFGTVPKECEGPQEGPLAVCEPNEELSIQEPGPEIAAEQPSENPPKKARLPRKTAAKPKTTLSVVKKAQRRSPQVADALC